jgi:MFS family permease
MGLAMLGFLFHNVPLMLAVIFLMSAQSAYFGPTKYGLLPELLPEKQLSWGNGVIGLGTFLSVIAGTITAGYLSDVLGEKQVWSGAVLIGLACLGTLASTGITRLPAANPAKIFEANPLSGLASQLRLVRRDRVLSLAVIGSTFLCSRCVVPAHDHFLREGYSRLERHGERLFAGHARCGNRIWQPDCRLSQR